MSAVYKDDQEDWLTVCLKYLLFVFNFLFWVSESNPLFELDSQKPLVTNNGNTLSGRNLVLRQH